MAAKAITEKDGEQEKWYAEARGMTLDKLPTFLKRLSNDYAHDYGTICHAIAAAAIAAAWAVEKSPSGGITGFQASCIAWSFIENWGSPNFDKDLGARFLDVGDLLYPQYEHKWRGISKDTLARVQAAAKKKLTERAAIPAHEAVMNHWRFLANGGVPFGLTVQED